MANPVSFIRSAAQATFSAYRSVPVRWRLGGGSAALTFVILAAFAGAVAVLTDRSVEDTFQANVANEATSLQGELQPPLNSLLDQYYLTSAGNADGAQIRIFGPGGKLIASQNGAIKAGQRDPHPSFRRRLLPRPARAGISTATTRSSST